jgi:class 3 adenylate cyclase
MMIPQPLGQVGDLARRTQAAGFSGLLFAETGRTAYLNAAVASQAAPVLELSTGVAQSLSGNTRGLSLVPRRAVGSAVRSCHGGNVIRQVRRSQPGVSGARRRAGRARLRRADGHRYLADHIPGARYLEVDGADHAPWFTEPDTILTEIEEFLTGSHAAPPQSHRALRTVLFTDIVASTQHAAATGDERWRAVLHRFGEITAELTQQFGGTVVKSTGDGHLATFEGPTQAIRCAEALRAEAQTLGIEIRAGIHTGECELLDADIGGIAVHIAARICGQAGAREILVSRTVRDLVVGSGTGFEDRGSVELRGVPGTWQLLAVDRRGARTGSAEAELASMPTPGRRTAMRRSDRAVEVIATRAPWIMRGMARLVPATGRR